MFFSGRLCYSEGMCPWMMSSFRVVPPQLSFGPESSISWSPGQMWSTTFWPTSAGSGTSSTTPFCGTRWCGSFSQVQSPRPPDQWNSLKAFTYSYLLTPFPFTVRSNLIPSPPTYNSKYGYLSWESYYNLSYYTRLLPPVPEDCPTPVGVKGQPIIYN